MCYSVEMTEDTSSLGSSIATSADDLCEAEAEEDVPTLQKTLEMLSLSEYVSTFEKERIDMESLVLKPSLVGAAQGMEVYVGVFFLLFCFSSQWP